MAGMKFEYDENGGMFSYFLLCVYALILSFVTYWSWPRREVKKNTEHPEEISPFEPCQEKYQLLHKNEPSRKRRIVFKKIAFVIAWIVFFILAYRTTLIQTQHKDYDPFVILNIDPEASISEIKRAYRELSKKYHPDRGGDPQQFKEIVKAYKALTDEEAKENWKKYGNPDGPGVTQFGIALPKWLVDHQNSLTVLIIYTSIFMIVLPVIICVWYRKSVRYVGEEILLDTIQFYSAYIRNLTTMNIKNTIMILSFAKEFDRTRNPAIIDRPSDNIEIPKLMRQIEDIPKKNKGLIQHPYSIKARTLIYAHLCRLGPLTTELENDKRYVIKRSIFLINGMINIEAQLVAVKQAGGLKSAPSLLSIENTMKLSPMIIQALFNPNNPFRQLPYLTENHFKYFETKKRTIRSIQQFLALDNDERRLLLRSLTDEQYTDIMNVLSIYPYVTMNISWKVFDDENECKITAGSVITLTVHIQRENMSNLFSKNTDEEQQIDEKENDEKMNEAVKKATNTSSKSWNNKKKKTHKDKGKKKGSSTTSKSTKQSIKTTEINDSSDDDSSKNNQDSLMNVNQSTHDLNESENDEENLHRNDSDDDEFLEKFQEQQRKREKLETKSRISHRVYCPFYPEIKQECWWLYVADRKRNELINIPIYICTFKTEEETEIKFKAPDKQGHYEYTVHLRSDSYFGVDISKNLPLNVEEAKEMENNHPQWNFGDDEGGDILENDDNQFATESDSDTN